MIYILIELNGFRQLKKIDRTLTDTIEETMNSTFQGEDCKFIDYRHSIFTFLCSGEDQDLSLLFTAILDFFNYLKSKRDYLTGFNILLTEAPTAKTADHQGILHDKLFLTDEDESLYVSKGLISILGSFAEFTESNNLYKLLSFNKYKQDQGESIVSFLSRSKGMEKYIDSLEPYINGDKRGLVFFYSRNSYGFSFLSFSIALLLQGKTRNVPWIYIKSDRSGISDINSLINCMNRDFMTQAEKYLSGVELLLWKEKFPLIEDNNRVIFDEDALVLFRLYLKAYSRRMEELYLPPIVFILDSHRFDEQTAGQMAIILEDLYLDLNLIPVLFSEEEDLPAVYNLFKGKKFQAGEWILESDQGAEKDSGSYNSPVAYYHASMLFREVNEIIPENEVGSRFRNDLGYSVNHFLLLYSLFQDLCDKEMFLSLLVNEQQEKMKNEKIWKDMVFHGFIYPGNLGITCLPDNSEELYLNLKQDEKIVISGMVESILDQTEGFKLIIYEKISYLFRKIGMYKEEALYILKTIDELIVSNKASLTGPFFKRISQLIKGDLTGDNRRLVEFRQNICFLKAAIYDNRDDFAMDVYQRLTTGEIKDSILDSERKISCSDYLYAQYKFKKALDLAKSALLDIQDSDNRYLKTQVNFTIAKILMGMKRIDESKDYFRIAKEILERERDIFLILEINSFEAVVNFSFGNFSESLRLLEESFVICETTGKRDWQLFLVFLHGRVMFELGEYRKAVSSFTEGLRLCGIYFDGKKKDIFNIWLGRCFIYLGEYRYGLKILDNYDFSSEALYFSAEGLYFLEEYNNSMKKIETAFDTEQDRIRLFCSSNITSWESGYDFIEDRSLVSGGGHGVLFQLIRAFRAFLSVKTGNESDGWKELVRLSREDRLSETDLNNGYYYYLHALTLPENTGAAGVDRITLLSKALRHIQQTASRIDNPKHRQLYLNHNYWNGSLMDEGRQYKLI